MKRLDGQRILLVAPRFFGYDKDIGGEISRRGAQVDLLPDRPFDTPLMTALTRLSPARVLPAADRLYERLLAGFGARHYDTILVVNGQTLSPVTLRLLRSRFPTARRVLYMWDSVDNRRGVIDNLRFYDDTFSFDPASARQYGMRLRPLFFSSGFERPPAGGFEHHISFVGTAHTDRFAVIDRLRQTLPAGLNAYWYLYLQAPWVYHAYRLSKAAMRRSKRDDFRFAPLDKATLQSVFSRSLSVLDIEHPRQRGLTMRTFETMGSHKKLITTNAQVRDYDFYRPENICVIDRAAPRVPAGFFESPFVPVGEALYRRYSLAGWVDEVLGDTAPAASEQAA